MTERSEPLSPYARLVDREGMMTPDWYAWLSRIPAPRTFAALPSSPTIGMEFNISDSNTIVFGAAAAGGGANQVKVRWNGTNWTVMGI